MTISYLNTQGVISMIFLNLIIYPIGEMMEVGFKRRVLFKRKGVSLYFISSSRFFSVFSRKVLISWLSPFFKACTPFR